MRWPWASVAWKDAYERERAEVVRLTDALMRIERVREGLPELAPERRKPVEPLPAETQMIIERMWSEDHARKGEEKRARQLYAKHQDWKVVNEVLLEVLREPEEVG